MVPASPLSGQGAALGARVPSGPPCGGPVPRAGPRQGRARSRLAHGGTGAAGYASPGLHHQRRAIRIAFASLAGRPMPATPTHRRARERQGRGLLLVVPAWRRTTIALKDQRPLQFSGENRFLRCLLTRRLRRP